jgi:integrase
MAGQLIKRGERTWLVRVYLGSDSRGKRRYLNKTIHGTRKDAQGWLNDALKRKDLGEEIGQSAMLCSEFFEKWLQAAVRHRVRERSLENYEYVIGHYVTGVLGREQISRVKPIDLQQLYSGLLARGLSAKTVGYVHVILGNAFKQAVRWGLIRSSPSDLVDPPRQERLEMRSLSAEDAKRMLAAVTDEHHRLILALAIASGARPCEYLALKWSDIDWQAGSVTIQRSLVWNRTGGWYFSEPKTARSRRSVPLPPPVMRSLSEHKRHQAEDRMLAGQDWQQLELVFARYDGLPLKLDEVRKSLDGALKAAGLKRVRLYDLRHSCASILMASGINPKIVAERLGHTSTGITMDTYSHLSPGMQQQATDRLEEAVFG